MAANQAGTFNLQELTDTGGPLVGGRLYTYSYGTTTHKTAYTDAGGSVAQTYTSDGSGGQYIALNSRGEIPAPLYLVSGSYDLCLKRSDGTTVWTRRADGQADADDVAGLTAGSLTFSQTSTYTAGTVGNALSHLVINVKTAPYNAVGDGVTDDSAAITAAVATVVSRGGGVVYLPSGDYLINTKVQVALSGVRFVGAGAFQGGTRVINGQTNLPAIQFGDGVSTYYGMAMRDILFAQKSGVVPISGNCGFRATKIGQSWFDGLGTSAFPAALYNGLEFLTVTQTPLSGLQVQANLTNGVTLGTCSDITITASRSDSNGQDGWYLYDTAGLYAASATGYNNTRYAWNLADGSTHNNNNHFYTSCVGDTSGNHNWSITQLKSSSFVGCWGSTQQDVLVNTSADGFYVSGSNCTDLSFSDCISEFNNLHGMYLDLCTGITVTNFRGGGNNSHGNGRAAGGGSGLAITANANTVNVQGGALLYNATYGIQVAATATNVSVQGVRFVGNVTANVLSTSPSANCVFRNNPGYNPRTNNVTTPSVPASTVNTTNTTGFDCMVYITGGTTVTDISVDNSFVLVTTPAAVLVPAGSTIKMTYAVAPVWKWMGL